MPLTSCFVRAAKFRLCGKRHRRRLIKAFITKLIDRVRESELKGEFIHVDQLEAERLQKRLTNMDCEFRTDHHGVVALLEEEGDIEKEHDNK